MSTIVACHARTIPLLHGWGSFSEWVSNAHWLKLTDLIFDLIFPWRFNSYLFGCYLSTVEFTSRSGEVFKESLWRSFIWILLDSPRKPQQTCIQTRGIGSKWFVIKWFSTKFHKLYCQHVHRIGNANLTYGLPLVFIFLSLSLYKSE